MWRVWLIPGMVMLLAACSSSAELTATPAPPQPTTAAPASAWGAIIALGQAEQTRAPAIYADDDRLIAVWSDADADGDAQIAAVVEGGRVIDTETLALGAPPISLAHNQLLLRATNGLHLIWLGAPRDDSGGMRVWNTYLGLDGTPERAAAVTSDARTEHFTALDNGDGTAWVVWSGGLVTEPELFIQYLDPVSRARVPTRLTGDGVWPQLLRRPDGAVWLLWQTVTDRQIMAAPLTGERLGTPHRLVTPPLLYRGDVLMGFASGQDATTVYLFWTILRADGDVETWFTSGTLDAESWPLPARLGLNPGSGESFETGFNGGAGVTARAGNDWVRAVSPADGLFDVLALAVEREGELGVLYLRAGAIVGYQAVVPLPGPLIGAPRLRTDRDRHLYLAWSQPMLTGTAGINLTATRWP